MPMKNESIKVPTPPPDRHLREGQMPKRAKYRLIKEVSLGGIVLFRVEKKGWFGWKCIFPTGMQDVFGGVRDEQTARREFDRLTGRVIKGIEILDEA